MMTVAVVMFLVVLIDEFFIAQAKPQLYGIYSFVQRFCLDFFVNLRVIEA